MRALDTRLNRSTRQLGWARFGRDVMASVVATGLATIAFSQLAHDPAPPAANGNPGKVADRLSWDVEDVPTRTTRTFDSLAMFAIPRAEPSAWSAVPAPAARQAEAAPARAGKARGDAELPRIAQAEEAKRPRQAALPPARPVPATLPEPVRVAEAAAPASGERRIHLRILGWDIPGTDLLPKLPYGREAAGAVASLGERARSLGGAVVETIGLR